MMLIGNDAKLKIKKGVDKLADMVKITLGPKGKNVLISKKFFSPFVTNDGICIAKHIELEDPYENAGALLVTQAANKTNEVGGDGTTTSTVLTQAILNEGLSYTLSGANPILMRRGMNEALNVAIKKIEELVTPITSEEDMVKVASISSGDDFTGRLIGKAISIVGHDGAISIEKSSGLETTLEITDGMIFDRGYMSSYMVTDADKMIAELENCFVLVTKDKIDYLDTILPLLEEVMSVKGRLLIICEDMADEPLSTIVLNKMKGAFNCVVVKAPAVKHDNTEFIEDIASIVGAKVVSETLGIALEDATVNDLGRVKKIKITEDKTTIIGGIGDREIIEKRISGIRQKIKDSTSQEEISYLKMRLSKLVGGVAIIKVGAPTEVALEELKLRIEDSVNATKASVEEGVVPGGGTAYIHAYKQTKKLKSKSKDIQIGYDIISNALLYPLKNIAENAGENGDVVVDKVKRLKTGYGFDALEVEYKDMVLNGIIDPFKVTKSALVNACSVGSSILTTDGIIIKE